MDKAKQERWLLLVREAMEKIERIQRKQAITFTRIEGIQSHGERHLRRVRDALNYYYQEEEDRASG